VKEYYFYLDNTPTHSYMKALYKYPQRAFPYNDLITTNHQRSRDEPEYELIDTGIFAQDRYFDVTIEYAKVDPQDILIRISVSNRGSEAAPLHVLPTLWFRNTWAWGRDSRRPVLQAITLDEPGSPATAWTQPLRLLQAQHDDLGTYWLACEGTPQLLFTDDETNAQRLCGVASRTAFVKDGIQEAVVNGASETVNPEGLGTKVAAHYRMIIAPGATEKILLRLSTTAHATPFSHARELFTLRQQEANDFYQSVSTLQDEEAGSLQPQALAGLLWSKQFYCYDVEQWLEGDPID
jgi:hypothetical protein